MESDHPGWIGERYKRNPIMKILCSKKTVLLLAVFYGIEDGIKAVGSGATDP